MADDVKSSADSILQEVQNRITDAFDVFDHDNSKVVDEREVGTIMRSLGCVFTEAELDDILQEICDEDMPGSDDDKQKIKTVKFDNLLPTLTKILMERKYRCGTEEELLRAFQVLDTEKRGELTQEELTKYMMEEGEAFRTEEMEEMLAAAVDPDTQNINYKEFVSKLIVEDI